MPKEIAVGQQYTGDFLILKLSRATTNNGKPYLSLTLKDETETLDGKLWDFIEQEHGSFKEGEVVSITGAITTFAGKRQLKITGMIQSLRSAEEYYRWTKFKVDDLWDKIVGLVDSFEEPLTKFVAEECLILHAERAELAKKAPAAKTVHNNWFGGFLEHVWSLCQLAEPVIRHYQTNYEPSLSRDKVLFGLIMHDLGKVVEYDQTSPAFVQTHFGILTNHIVLGPAWIYEAANKYSDKEMPHFEEERALLMHLVAAHHGQIEWGSPVRPATLEALLVHHLDNLDSKFMHALDLIHQTEEPGVLMTKPSYFEKTPYIIPRGRRVP